METNRVGEIAVIFASQRTDEDEAGYAAAAAEMEALAATQPGYRGAISTRGTNGFGITISYWASDADAKAWRDHPDHVRIRNMGRSRWYADYTLDVARIERGYSWSRHG